VPVPPPSNQNCQHQEGPPAIVTFSSGNLDPSSSSPELHPANMPSSSPSSSAPTSSLPPASSHSSHLSFLQHLNLSNAPIT
jgi:hypothetical protein